MRYTSVVILAGAATCSAGVIAERDQCSGNLIQNGGFEDHPDSVAPWDSYHPKILKGYKSKQAFGVSSEKKKTYNDVSQGWPACSSTGNYLVTWDQYLTSPVLGAEDGTVILPMIGITQAELGVDASTNGTWQHVKQIAPAPSDGYRYLDYTVASIPPGTAKLDNVVVTPFPTYTVDNSAANALKNGDFEKGSLSPWKAKDRHDVCKLQSPSVNSTSGTSYVCELPSDVGDSSIAQTVNLTPGQLYEFAFDYKLTARGNQWVCDVDWTLGDWLYIGGVFSTSDPTSDSNGVALHYSVPFYATKAKNVINIDLNGGYGGLKKARSVRPEGLSKRQTSSGCTLQVDNFSIKAATANA